MRVCRFRYEDSDLLGFFADDRVYPLDQAAEAFAADVGEDLELEGTDDLLDLLPPDGIGCDAARRLSDWIDQADAEQLEDLSIPVNEVDLVVPTPNPPKILLLAGNYAEHILERGGVAVERMETFPYVFMKPKTTLSDPGGPVVIPRISPDNIDWECELGVVIGRPCRNVPESEALKYVAGYTVINDISDRKFRPNPGRKPRERDKHFDWMHGKWHDTFLPVGPCILSADVVPDPQDLRLRLTVNGQVKQEASTGQMVFPVAAVIAFLSQWMTLEPGDLIATGTPSGTGSATGTFLKAGDTVIASIEGIGELESVIMPEES
ncbi:MAG: fumarylacetoacetate hydrolase family protein [Isosphaeraceae bacterium]